MSAPRLDQFEEYRHVILHKNDGSTTSGMRLVVFNADEHIVMIKPIDSTPAISTTMAARLSKIKCGLQQEIVHLSEIREGVYRVSRG